MSDGITTAMVDEWLSEISGQVNSEPETDTKEVGSDHKGYYGVSTSKGNLTCKKCGTEKIESEFLSGSGKRYRSCKPCRQNERRGRYRNSDEPQRVRARNLARYGLTIADYDQMLAEQQGRCATCPHEDGWDGRRLAVDHDHVTGKVRQLLCHPCNVTIGYIEKHDVPLGALVSYLDRHRPNPDPVTLPTVPLAEAARLVAEHHAEQAETDDRPYLTEAGGGHGMTHAETIAGLFHATYETLAPEHGYETRKASAVDWDDVPTNNKALMIATVQHMLDTGIIRPGALVNHIAAKAAARPVAYAERCPDNAPHLWVGRDGRPATGDDTDRCDACGAQRSTSTAPKSGGAS